MGLFGMLLFCSLGLFLDEGVWYLIFYFTVWFVGLRLFDSLGSLRVLCLF